MKDKSVSLILGKANPSQIRTGVARISDEVMDEIDVTTGDVIEISGRYQTVARCKPHFAWTRYKKLIRIDGIVRSNSGTKIGDKVTIRKVKPLIASKINVIPLNNVPSGTEQYLRDFLEDRAVAKDDKISLPYFEKTLDYHVRKITPDSDYAIITRDTVFHVDVIL